MTCDECKYFKIIQEPLRTEGTIFDFGRVRCEKHNLISDFCSISHKEFEQLDTCEDFEPQEISDRNLKMWEDIYAEEKRREGSDKE